MKPKQVTIKDVAREAGVSVATVSRALNGLGGLSEETREYVLSVCEKLAYVPNTLARGLVMQHTQTIGLVVPDITSPFYSRLMVLAAAEAKLCGYQVLLCSSFRNYEMEMDYFKLLIGNQVEGILFFPVGEESAKNLYHFLRYVPIVALNQMPEGNPIPYVCADERRSGQLAAEYLIGCGCRNLLFIGYEDRLAHRCRAESFLYAAEQAGIYAEIFESEGRYKSSFERGYRQFSEFLGQKRFKPEGVIAASDATANGVVKACMERNIAIPEDISLIGFDNINADLPTIELTSVSISHSHHVKRAIELLIRMRDGRRVKENEKHIFLLPELVERDSCWKRTSD
ncbi:LacI family DNA-binding transcriptional regulator [Clostridium sp. AN503]|uniref:LacI family DNA-binding transcriptional regulator n=1 Tax=Clostridium sp. AN503 TaxID=3160598 RepID=UPI003457EA42